MNKISMTLMREKINNFNFNFIKIVVVLFCLSFLFLGFINSVKAETPINVIFQDNFDNDSLGDLSGQNSWTPVTPDAGFTVGSKQVQVGEQGNQLQIQAETSSYYLDLINQKAQVQNVRVKVDFQATSSAQPDVWVRRSSFNGNSNGYWMLNGGGGGFYFFVGSGATQLPSSGSVSLIQNDWYTIEFQVVNNTDGNPVLSAWVYPQGTSCPDQPLMTYTDTNNYATSSGYVALGSNSATSVTNFDNFVIYSSDPQTVPTAPTNLQIIPQQNQISLTWDSPFNYGGSPILDYDIQYKIGSGSYITYVHTPNGALSSVIIPDLDGGSGYDFKISATNAIGTSPNVTGSGKPLSNINITSLTRAVANDPLVATIGLMRTVPDQAYGNTCSDYFYIPYIQTTTSLPVSASISEGALPSEGGVKFILDQGQSNQQILYSHSSPFSVTFSSIEKGEHTLDTYIVDSQNNIPDITQHDRATNIGIGDIFGAIGDSVTDGAHGTVYTSASDWTNASVKSNDNRNYSSCGDVAPDGHIELNNDLENVLGYPVFIFNEGVSGASSVAYVSLMQTSNWQNDISVVEPNKWLIHLGINDGFPDVWSPNIQSIIDTLNNTYNAQEIFLANHALGGTTWNPYVSNLVSINNNVILGPNFYTFYTNYPSLKYDSLHPTNDGQIHMGYLWANSISYPQNVSVSQNTGTITLNWDSLSLGSSVLNTAGYKVSYGTSSAVYTTTTDVGDVTTKDITGLTVDQTYYFTVSAYDDDLYNSNQTNISPEVSITIDLIPPTLSSIYPIEGSTILRGGQVMTFNMSENGDCRLATSNKSYDGMLSDISCTSNSLQVSCTLPTFTSGIKDIYVACKDSFDNKDTASSTSHISYRVKSRGTTVTTEPVTIDNEQINVFENIADVATGTKPVILVSENLLVSVFPSFTQYLKFGSRGIEVTKLQKFLIDKGYSLPAGATGYFGSQTQLALLKYQTANNITPTGTLGPITRDYINNNTTIPTLTNITKYIFNNNLKLNSVSEDVRQLQIYLNNNGFTVSETGAGSKGNESTFYGQKTVQAVKKFQETHRSEILTPNGFISGTGMFYESTRRVVNGE
ncbi:MAG: peptidoglycan-binding protein [Candidatus Paceibacterota bacterium]|jgi:peptidoglycan hydrolase-like protein with peptidoglycan-binding domain